MESAYPLDFFLNGWRPAKTPAGAMGALLAKRSARATAIT